MANRGGKKDRRVVLITGAGTGIGLALARTLLDTEMRLVLTARAESLSRFAEAGISGSERVWLRPFDVTDAETARRLIDEIAAEWDGVDVLVNNAGISYRAVIEHLTDADEIRQLEVNYLGPMRLARLVMPYMRSRRTGHIINLSSVGGMMAMPTMGAYSASKFALEGASEALWYELKPWRVHVTLLEPGFVHSNAFRRVVYAEAAKRSERDAEDAYHPYYKHMGAFIEKMMKLSPTTPDQIARMIVKTMNSRNPPLRLGATPDATIFSLLRRLLPKRLYHYVLYRCLPHIRTWAPKDNPHAPQT